MNRIYWVNWQEGETEKPQLVWVNLMLTCNGDKNETYIIWTIFTVEIDIYQDLKSKDSYPRYGGVETLNSAHNIEMFNHVSLQTFGKYAKSTKEDLWLFAINRGFNGSCRPNMKSDWWNCHFCLLVHALFILPGLNWIISNNADIGQRMNHVMKM